MLELDQNLEADLGIDSIKRAEIFGGLLENVGFSQNDQEREEYFLAISKLRTVREVLGWLKERARPLNARLLLLRLLRRPPSRRQGPVRLPRRASRPTILTSRDLCVDF